MEPDTQWRLLLCSGIVLLLLLFCLDASSAQNADVYPVQVIVRDDQSEPRPGVKLDAGPAGVITDSSTTAVDGKATIRCPRHEDCIISASAPGYLSVHLMLTPQDESAGRVVEIALARALQTKETVTVHAQPSSPVAEAASSQTTLSTEQAATSPLRPSTLVDTLPLVPGVRDESSAWSRRFRPGKSTVPARLC